MALMTEGLSRSHAAYVLCKTFLHVGDQSSHQLVFQKVVPHPIFFRVNKSLVRVLKEH